MPVAGFFDERHGTSAVTLDVNVWGPIHGGRLVAPGMIERGRGHIVDLASGLGKVSVPGLAVYVASKHAVVGLSATLRQELAGTGVTVTAVMPADVARASCAAAAAGPPRWESLRRSGPVLAPTQAAPPSVRRPVDRAFKADHAITQLDRVGRAGYERRVREQADQLHKA